MERYDLIISGGGMVGMSLGLAMAREGLSVALLEKSSLPRQLEPAFDGRVSAIALGSKHMLQRLGAWDLMAAEAQPISDIRVSDGDTPFFLHYNHHEIGEAPFGYIVENRHIRQGLIEAAKEQKNLTIMDGTALQGFEAQDGTMRVRAGDKEMECRLFVGADGKQSQVRALAGIGALEWNYRQTAIVCTIAHELPHEGLAQERFLPAGPFAVLPMKGRRSSLVWVEPDARVDAYLDLPEEEFVQEIAERVGGYLGKITLAGKRFAYPLSVMHAKTYVGKRLALVGDAAHAIHPIAGQGVNLGFRDVAVLHELIAGRAKLGLDIGGEGLLAHYQQWRRFDNTTMLTVTDALNRLFSNDWLPVRTARDLGLWAVGKLPPVKKFFMRHAMGLSGDIPALARPMD